MSKKRVVKDYDALPEEIIRALKMAYPTGFHTNLLQYTNKEGKMVSALPFETDEAYYLIRMTVLEAKRLIQEDDDYDKDGVLRENFADLDDDSYLGDSRPEEDDLVEGNVDEDDHIMVVRRRDADEATDIADESTL